MTENKEATHNDKEGFVVEKSVYNCHGFAKWNVLSRG